MKRPSLSGSRPRPTAGSPLPLRLATTPSRRAERGVALVITLILLAVITFMTVTLLVVSRRERERVGTSTLQTQALFAGKAGADYAQSEVLALALANTNSYDLQLLVSTNYVSPAGFIRGNRSLTNVGYTYANGATLNSANDLQQNLNNLLILPRAPVFVSTTNRSVYSDFRYYLDLNRNGVYDTNGFAAWRDTNGVIRGTNFFTGDPEWVGILDKPELRHSASNQFVGRYCFVVLPIGNLLDINFIHNQAKRISPRNDGFLRNQGFGSWELNLAAFLQTLNPRVWGASYQYRTNYAGSDGLAFSDAAGLLQYRYGGGYNVANNLLSVNQLFGTGQRYGGRFLFDAIDGYPSGGSSLMTGIFPPALDSDNPSQPWSGADNATNFFTTQDFFTPVNSNSFPGFAAFQKRLLLAGQNTNSSDDRYTYYNLLAQMGMGSAPESPFEMGVGAAIGQPARKLNLNYNNLPGLSATNLVEWNNALQFFTNAANLLLTNAGYNFGVSRIPVFTNGVFVYSPSVQRLLQLSANIYDATTHRTFDGNAATMAYPSVFRPYFSVDFATNIFIAGFLEVTNGSTFNSGEYAQIPLALPEQSGLLPHPKLNQSLTFYSNIYSVPWIIGAKKGFPNFNEFAMASVSQVTRKLQISKPSAGAPRTSWSTNIAYVVGISNAIGVEAWNSYSNAYPRAVDMVVADNLVMALWMTNRPGQPGTLLATTNVYFGSTNRPASGILPNTWTGVPPNPLNAPALTRASFQIPVMTNFMFVPDSILHLGPPSRLQQPGSNDVYETTTSFTPVPQLILAVTNRFRFIMRDVATGRIIDYVALNGLDTVRDLTAELISGTDTLGVWNTNTLTTPATARSITRGINNQILISSGATAVPANEWNKGTLSQLDQTAITLETSQFRNFLNNSGSNLVMQAPYTPTAKYSQYWSWQANDPLVHYTPGDLATVFAPTNNPTIVQPPNSAATNNYLVNIQVINNRYQPWGGNPLKQDKQTAKIDMNLAYKDPYIRKSDDWRFPTNKFPNIGWLGRVHRGTPWQTVYLKSSTVVSNDWKIWTGNPNALDAGLTQPTNDWRILDLFTVAQNDNASRGQLSVNQTNLAAWAAVLGGVITVTNPNPTVSLTAPLATFSPYVIDPTRDSTNIQRIITALNDVRRTNIVTPNLLTPNVLLTPGVFTSLGQILATPELTVNSPFLDTSASQAQWGLCDEAYERIPQQILSLLKVGDPRYVIFAWGQSLKPAPGSIIQSGPFFGMPTNSVITGEIATRSVVRIDHRPTLGTPVTGATQPQVVTESFTVLPPE